MTSARVLLLVCMSWATVRVLVGDSDAGACTHHDCVRTPHLFCRRGPSRATVCRVWNRLTTNSFKP